MLELIISDAIRRAKKRVPLKGLPRLERQRTLISEALMHVGWGPSMPKPSGQLGARATFSSHRQIPNGGRWDV